MGQCKAVIGEKDGPEYFSFVGTIFIVIFINNMIGLIPGFLPPTEQTSYYSCSWVFFIPIITILVVRNLEQLII